MTPLEQARGALRPRPEIGGLRAYRIRQDAAVKLNQNESPLDWPEEVKTAVLARVAARAWHRYPPADGEPLRRALAAEAGVDPEMIAVTNGSNEAILAVVETFATGRSVILTTPGYSMAEPLALVGGARVRRALLRSDFTLDVPAMRGEMQDPDTALVFLASPNNPTGNAFARRDIEAVLEAAPGVVVDEAYVQFAGDSFIADLARYPHLLVLRTFSKAFALAGARIGWIIAAANGIAAVRRALPPYNLNVFAQEAALAVLERRDLVAERVRDIVRERQRLFTRLAALPGVMPFPSQTNFILFRTPLEAGTLFERLLHRGVLVRDVSSQPLLDRCLRVTVGTPGDNDRFLEALQAALEERA